MTNQKHTIKEYSDSEKHEMEIIERVASCVHACRNIPNEVLDSGVIGELVEACERALEIDLETAKFKAGFGEPTLSSFGISLELLLAKLRGEK